MPKPDAPDTSGRNEYPLFTELITCPLLAEGGKVRVVQFLDPVEAIATIADYLVSLGDIA